jgi:DNA (cytosine-5)-methyltransferase 1
MLNKNVALMVYPEPMSSQSPSLIGLFAGVGGIELGFEQAGFRTLLANEIDDYAAKTYNENHSHALVHADIKNVSKSDFLRSIDGGTSTIDLDKLTVLAGGFPCQPFSVAGLRKGFEDDRGNVFWEIHRLIRELNPEVVFLENVKNLEGHDQGNTFRTILDALEGKTPDPSGNLLENPYWVTSKVLNAKDFGVPQNRERIYIVAFRSQEAFTKFSWDDVISDGQRPLPPLSDFIDFEAKVPDRYYYDEARPMFEALKEGVTSSGTVYQWRRQYVRENKSGLCPTLTANMGMGGHNVPIVLTRHGIRKLTPRECFALMGMPNLKFPSDIAESRLYKQAGNAVVVPVIHAIAQIIKTALDSQSV